MPRKVATRPDPYTAAMTRLGLLLLGASTAALLGCETGDLNRAAKNESIFAIFQQDSPATAAIDSQDPYNPDKRYRGTNLLANAPFGGEDVYVKTYRMKLGAPPADKPDEDPGVRGVAARALGMHGDPADAKLIVPLLKEKDRRVRLEAIRALQRIHNPDVIPDILPLVSDQKEPDKDVRAEACDCLGQYAEPRVLQALVDALDDDDLIVTSRARRSLRTLTGQDFGEDQKAWLEWEKRTPEPFAARTAYIYPVFERDKFWWEWIPLWPDPPNEVAAQPVGSGGENMPSKP